LGHGRDGAFSYRDYCEVESFFGVADDYFGYDAKAVTAELLKRGWIIKGKGRDLKECTEDPHSNRQAIADCVSQQTFFQGRG
jgi:hypothetical protein